MTRASRIGRATAILALLTVPGACHRDDRTQTPSSARDAPSTQDDGVSIFALDVPMTDQDSRAVTFADFSSRLTVAAMTYASCTSICPRIAEDMRALEAQLTERVRAHVQFVLFSLDPARDTPEARRRFMAEHKLDPARWRLLATSEDGVRELAAVLGVKYVAIDDGQIAHSATLFVIDRAGVIRYRQESGRQHSREMLAAISERLN